MNYNVKNNEVLGLLKGSFQFQVTPSYSIAAKGELLTSKHSIPDFTVVLELQNCEHPFNPYKTTYSSCLPSRVSSLVKMIEFLQARSLE